MKQTLASKLLGKKDSADNTHGLLKILMDASIKNTSRRPNKNTYDEVLKQFSVYIFYIGGRLLYETLHANMKNTLPSVSTLARYVSNNGSRPLEGFLRFEELNQFLEERCLPKIIWISEDATRINGRLEYDSKTNTIVGLTLPLKQGLPVTDTYKATSANAIHAHYLNKNKAKYAYIIMAQPLSEHAPPFCLSAFGTDNKFNSIDVLDRWKQMKKVAASYDIRILGFSSDGDTRLLKAMRSASDFPLYDHVHHDNDMWSWFHMNLDQSTSFVQDTVHIGTKLRTRLLKPTIIPLGRFVASASHLKILISEESKDKHGLTPTDIKPEDKMNFKSAQKMCSFSVINLLSAVPASEGTIAYLQIMRSVLDAFLSQDIDISQRIYKMWFAVFFLRIWRNWIKETKECECFISLNSYVSIELNAHSLVKLVRIFRDEEHLKKDMFMSWLFSSQTCESTFRAVRSLTSTFFTAVNFSMLDILNRLNRIETINNVMKDVEQFITFPREKKKKVFNSSNVNIFLSDEDINRQINAALTMLCWQLLNWVSSVVRIHGKTLI